MLINEPAVSLGDDRHVVQFYGSDDEWIAEAGAYLTTAVLDGRGVVVIAG